MLTQSQFSLKVHVTKVDKRQALWLTLFASEVIPNVGTAAIPAVLADIHYRPTLPMHPHCQLVHFIMIQN